MPWIHMGEWRYSSTFLGLGIRWRWVVSCTPLPLYPRGNGLLYWLVGSLGGSQIWSGRCGEKTKLELPGIEPWPSNPQLIAIPTVSRIRVHTIKLRRFLTGATDPEGLEHADQASLKCDDANNVQLTEHFAPLKIRKKKKANLDTYDSFCWPFKGTPGFMCSVSIDVWCLKVHVTSQLTQMAVLACFKMPRKWSSGHAVA
jgi:hypothetical protein